MVVEDHVGVVHEHLGSTVLTLTVNIMSDGAYWCHVVLDGEDDQEVNASYGGCDLEALLDRCARLVEVFS
jgi:hypothetical protein